MTDRLTPAAEAGRGGPDAVRHAPALRRPFALGGRALRSITAIRVDLLGLVGLVLLFAAWQLLTNVIPRYSLPTPLGVAGRIWEDFILAEYLSAYGLPKTGLLNSMLYTGSNVLIAVALGAAIGTIGGLVTGRFEKVRAVLDPVLMTAGTIPILVLAPFFLIWFGVGRTSAVLLVGIYVSVILYVFAQRAASNLDPVYEEAAYTLGASPRRMVWDVLIPGTVPQILGGVRIALAGAWGLEAIAELLGAQQGIGKIVQVLAGSIDMQGIFAALVILGLVAIIFDALAALLFSYVAGWSVAARTGGE
ncbi:MAG: ABC transporter permease subunit [Proteobacteria bacterium]|nr:ABC transporter permease subunit [Pseudomonadota bacterium]